jgi:hypothetical protein
VPAVSSRAKNCWRLPAFAGAVLQHHEMIEDDVMDPQVADYSPRRLSCRLRTTFLEKVLEIGVAVRAFFCGTWHKTGAICWVRIFREPWSAGESSLPRGLGGDEDL